MKKIIIFLFTIITFYSCNEVFYTDSNVLYKKVTPVKPYHIYSKFTNFQDTTLTKYYYYDSVRTKFCFIDFNNRYNVGDTIK